MLCCICNTLESSVLCGFSGVFETSGSRDLTFLWRNRASELSSWLGENVSEYFQELEIPSVF